MFVCVCLEFLKESFCGTKKFILKFVFFRNLKLLIFCTTYCIFSMKRQFVCLCVCKIYISYIVHRTSYSIVLTVPCILCTIAHILYHYTLINTPYKKIILYIKCYTFAIKIYIFHENLKFLY